MSDFDLSRIERQLDDIDDRLRDAINKRQGDDIVALLQDLARGGIAIDASELGNGFPDDTLTSIASSETHLSDIADAATDISGSTTRASESLEEINSNLVDVETALKLTNALLQDEADDRAKQRRYMRFNLVQEIDDWERRAVEDDDTDHAEGMLLRLRAELEMLDDLWPDTAAVALTAVRR